MIGRHDLLQLVRGFLMGGADIIPGVSGGTVALILGIYRRLVAAISRVDLTFVRLLVGFEIREAAAYIDLRFLAFLGAGIATGILGLATTMNFLLEHHLERTHAAFFGMILASCAIVFAMIEGFDVRRALGLVFGLAFAYWLVGLAFLENPPDSLGYVFLCGTIAICAMILPGISGAFVLLILGEYHAITSVLRDLLHGQVTTDRITTVVVFVCGAALGLVAFSKLLRVLLDRARGMTMAVLVGFMLGSLRKIWPFKVDLTPDVVDLKAKQFENRLPDLGAADTWITLGILVVAGAFVLFLERLSTRHDPTLDDPVPSP